MVDLRLTRCDPPSIVGLDVAMTTRDPGSI